MIVDRISEELKEKPIKRDTDLSIENNNTESPGDAPFEYPKAQNGKDKIFNGSVDRGYVGSKEHPRG